MQEIQFARVATNGISLNVAQAGPADGPLMILLHGFPEFWYGWKKHIPALAAAGFCVWAPDQRGYNTSDKPPRVRDYAIGQLSADIVGLIDAAGRERAIVVGHDWGGAVAWWVASNFPERLARLVIINVPHPLVLRRLIMTSPRQMLRSWYMFAMQIPWLMEAAARRGDWRAMVQGLQDTSLPGTFSDEDFEQYRRAWSQPPMWSGRPRPDTSCELTVHPAARPMEDHRTTFPEAITAMINWYRAAMRIGAKRPRHESVSPPTLLLWGARDKFIGREGATLSLDKCERGELATFEHNTHWLPHEEPQEVTRRILEFRGRDSAA